MNKKARNLLSIILTICMVLSLVVIAPTKTNVEASKKKVIMVKRTFHVGKETKINLKKYGLKGAVPLYADDYYERHYGEDEYSNEDSVHTNCGSCNAQTGYIWVRPSKPGVFSETVKFDNGKRMRIYGKVKGKPAKAKKYNKLMDMIQDVDAGTFTYDVMYLDFLHGRRNTLKNEFWVKFKGVKNNSDHEAKVDLKVAFYDKNKKFVTSIQGTDIKKKYYFNLDTKKKLEAGEYDDGKGNIVCCAKLTEKQFSKIKYWRVLKIK